MRDLWSDVHVCKVQLMLCLLLTPTCWHHSRHRLNERVIHHFKSFLVEHLRLQVVEIALITRVVRLRVIRVIILAISDLYLYFLVLLPILKLVVLHNPLRHWFLLIVALIAVGPNYPVCVLCYLVLVAFLGQIVLLIEVLMCRHVHSHPTIVLVAACCCHRLHHHVGLVARRSWILKRATEAHLTVWLQQLLNMMLVLGTYCHSRHLGLALYCLRHFWVSHANRDPEVLRSYSTSLILDL